MKLLLAMHKTVTSSAACRPIHEVLLQATRHHSDSFRPPQAVGEHATCSQQCLLSGAAVRAAPLAATAPGPRRSIIAAAGLPFSLSKPQKILNFKWGRRLSGYSAADLQVEVDALSEGQPAGLSAAEVQQLLDQLQQDAEKATPLALQAKQQLQPSYRLPAIANLSLVLCDDAHIQQLNMQYRGKDAPTDVLSFEIPDESPALQLPVKLLGDLVVSLDTAARQAEERG
jgi:hypothetical protein